MCIPETSEELAKLHLFSAKEARQCLSNVTLAVAGDSYAQNLFIGSSEVLLATVSNNEIQNGTIRRAIMTESNTAIQSRRETDKTFPSVLSMCIDECYGDQVPFRMICSKRILDFMEENKGQTILPVVGAAIRVYNIQFNRNVTEALAEMRAFFKKIPGLVYTSQPCYGIDKVPERYRKLTSGREQLYWKMLPLVSQFNMT